ncbi:MAG: glycine cleavage system aminomethyltransferase GcvT [Candidatus Omnitrophica bacterium]|nr:glycine cleavage system aminomethyltransferase GcvT [Candidatus Omnitrophota bacterium]MBU4488553.1 glycine cleavage system aminomethyltransferase GcvT [Candidatus Omnitrophota bacterium]MCG2705428.1 glycine cleavage system aminomethyltransferase GcvT [Candidatus Omnitrophota bacterium]
MQTTPLINEHLKLKAKMAPFAGWNMPIQYEGIIAEHNYTRQAASLFDICHMGEFYVKGDALNIGLENMFSFSVTNMPIGKCRYGAMLNENGGIVDDLVAYRIAKNEWLIVVNAGTIEKDFAHIKFRLKKESYIENRSPTLTKLDLQGPLSRDIMAKLINPGVANLKYYTFNHFDILGERNIISRTGYTGELGYELYISTGKAVELWNLLLKDKRLKPAGLGARDTLRLEMGYSLYGQDVDDNTTPLEAGLEKFINFDRDFIGKDALLRQRKIGVKRLLVGFKADSRKSPRHGHSITKDGRSVGIVTSGSFAPSLSCGIGLGYIETAHAKTGENILIKSGDVEINAAITAKPFYTKGTARS